MLCRTENIQIAGLASAVPESVFSNEKDGVSLLDEKAVRKTIKTTGIRNRHLANPDVCASDLCAVAAERLLSELDWDPKSIDLLVFVTQTPDYRLPSSSFLLQERLGLSKDCAVFDINLGCTGYVYGLWIISSLMQTSESKRALLLVGDTISKVVSPQDKSCALLFGDAGTATALTKDSASSPMSFVLGTDGTGAQKLMVPAGGFRTPSSVETSIRTEREGENYRSDEELYMNGAEVFAFTLREIPLLYKNLMNHVQWKAEEVDALVPHQANRFIIDHLCRTIGFPAEKVIIDLEDFGNTSSASIPLSITNRLHQSLREQSQKLLLIGFGVGWSWAAAAVEWGPMVVSDLTYV